jgi:hypothetical protein
MCNIKALIDLANEIGIKIRAINLEDIFHVVSWIKKWIKSCII